MRILLAAFALIALVPAPSNGQAHGSSTSPRAGAWRAPRTPWGDPDLQGNFTNVFESGTPLERPDEFKGRRLEDVKGDELVRLKQTIQQQTYDRFLGPTEAPPHWWGDALLLTRGSQAWFIVEPPDGKIPPLTADGQRRAAAPRRGGSSFGGGPFNGPEDFSLYDRCITRGFPESMMPGIYGNSYQIVQGPGYVAIRYEMVHETRSIPLDGRPHVGSPIRMDMGDARGPFEGDTLVVETTNFRARSVYRNANPETLKVVERFTRTAPDQVRWAVTIEDPSTWTRPWTFSLPLTIDDSQPVFEYACHEGNYGLKNILEIARAEEKAP